MKKLCYKILVVLLTLVGGTTSVSAQFNPDNPADPNALFRIELECTPAGVASMSGDGLYQAGENLTINTNSNREDYVFSHWTLNGVKYCDTPTFNYTMTDHAVKFVAHYSYVPIMPGDPVAENKHHVYLQSEPAGVCSFNRTNGERAELEDWFNLEVFGKQGYRFLGWYEEGAKISESESFYYLMPNKNVTLTAKFTYNPFNPDDPFGDGTQEDIDNGRLGDVNGDEVVNVTDAIELINSILANKTSSLNIKLCDMNKDGEVNVTDAIEIINTILKGN